MCPERVDPGSVAPFAGRVQTATSLAATGTIWREGNLHVALCPEFDVASQGSTASEARLNLREALELFFEHSSPEERERRWTPPVR